MSKRSILAKFGTVPKSTQRWLIRTVKEVIEDPSKRPSFYDESRGVGYCVSFANGGLCISTSEPGNMPNVSALPFLTTQFGEPTKLLSMPSSLRPELMIFYMVWDDFKIGKIQRSSSKNPSLII